MRIEKVAQDYYLFFNGAGEKRVKRGNLPLELEVFGGELSSSIKVWGSNLLDAKGNSPNKKVRVLKEEGLNKMVDFTFHSDGLIEIKIGKLALDYLEDHNKLVVPLPYGDGFLRIFYG